MELSESKVQGPSWGNARSESTSCFEEIRVAPDWVKIREVSIGVYWCPYLGRIEMGIDKVSD